MRAAFLLAAALPLAHGIRIVQSNDDGWAEANIRTLFNVLDSAGHEPILSAPAQQKSGTGSRDAAPKPLDSNGCIHSSCPANSPATGANTTDPRLNYVNSFPVTSIKRGIEITGPALWGSNKKPELALTGPNVGTNLAIQVPFSGTVGAAVYAVKEAGIPAIAFSGRSGKPTSWEAETPLHSRVYADLALNITSTVLQAGAPYLPDGVWLNVNFPAVEEGKCDSAGAHKFVLTRINVGVFSSKDAKWCGTERLPNEAEVALFKGNECLVTISPGDAKDKTTVDRERQEMVIEKLKPILSCLP